METKAWDILKIKNVLSVSILSGQYDLIIEVLVDSNKEFIKFISKKLSGVGGITKTETFLILKSFNKWV